MGGREREREREGVREGGRERMREGGREKKRESYSGVVAAHSGFTQTPIQSYNKISITYL